MQLYARQGDLVIEKLATKLPKENLRKRAEIVLAGGSSGHRHRLKGPLLVDDSVTAPTYRLRVGSTTTLIHEKPDGHKPVKLTKGDYEIRPLRERGDQSDRAVED